MSELPRQEALKAEGGRGYDAFICYSYTQDWILAQALQAAIEAMARPVPFVRRLRVFRDQSDLEATPHLWESIQRELARSRYLILLASPAAAASKWVPRELEEFLRRHPVEQVLVVLTAGTTSFLPREQGEPAVPPLLEEALKKAGAEPLVLDLRELRGLDARQMRQSPILAEVAARLSARLLGLPLSQLWGVHRRLRQRWSLAIGTVAVALLALLAVSVLSGVQNRALVASEKILRAERRELAEQQRRLASDRAKVAETALVRAIKDAGRSLQTQSPLPTDVRKGLAAAIAEASDLRVLGHRDRGASVLALCPQWDLALIWHPGYGLVKWSLSTGASSVLREKEGTPSPEGVQCAAKSPIAVLRGEETEPRRPWVETWDLLQEKRIARMEGELWVSVADATLSPDGTIVAATLADGMIYTWEGSTGKRLRRFRQPERSGNELMFSPAGDLLLVDSVRSGQVTIWDHRTGAIRATLKGRTALKAPGQWTPDGRQFLLTDERRTSVVALDGTVMQRLPEYETGIWQAGFDGEARRILIAGQDGRAAILERATGREWPRLTGHAGSVRATAFSQDGKYAATVGGDKTLRLWNTSTGELLKVFWHADSLKDAVAFTSDGSALVTATEAGTVHVWSILAGLFVGTRNGSCHPSPGSEEQLKMAVLDQSRYALLICPQSGKLHLVDVETGQEEDIVEWKDALIDITDAAISRDGRRLLLGGRHGEVTWFDRDQRHWKPMPVKDVSEFLRVSQVAWEPSGHRFASATEVSGTHGTRIVIWDAERSAEVNRFMMRESASGLLFDSAGRRLLVGSATRLWALSQEGQERLVGSHPAEPATERTGVVFASGGGLHTVYALSQNGEYLEWNLDTGTAEPLGETKLMAPFVLPSRPLFQLQYDEAWDQIIVEDSNTGVPLARLAPEPAVQGGVGSTQKPFHRPRAAFIVEEGKALLVQGEDGWLRKWLLPKPLPRDELGLLRRACEHLSSVSRAETPRECAQVPSTAGHK